MTSKPGAESEVPMPNLHDGSLVGIVLLAEDQCVLFVADAFGAMQNLTLTGIEGLRADNFLEGNIVLDVTIQTGAEVSEEDVLFALSIDMDHVEQHRAFVGSLGQDH